MGGVGKFIKKNPIAAIGLLGLATGGLGLAGIGPMAGLAAGGAAGGAAGAAGAAEGLGAAGVLGGAAEGGGGALAGFSGLGGANAAAMAPMGLLANAAPEYAALNAQGFNPAMPGMFDKIGAFADKVQPYAKMAGQAQGLMAPQEQPQAPQIQPPQLRGPGQALQPQPMYGGGGGGLYGLDPEEEKRRAYMAYMAQMQGVA
jgi:hypothetical protein